MDTALTATQFMLQDLALSAIALLLFPLFLLMPGYVLGWLINLFDFRQRRLVTRLLLGIVLSCAVFPSLTFLIGHIFSLHLAWALYVPIWAVFAFLIWPEVRRAKLPYDRWMKTAIALTVAWIIIAVFSLVDIGLGNGSYYSAVTYDHTTRVALTDAIYRTGIPPVNPHYYNGGPSYVTYYYFWSILPALLSRLTGNFIDSRISFMMSAVWLGIALRAIASLHLRFQSPERQQATAPRSAAAVLLFFIAGLDIFFSPLMLLAGIGKPWIAEGWNVSSQIDAWSSALLWVPHHVGSLVACLTGWLVFQSLQPHTPFTRRLVISIVVALCLVSAAGMSIYVTLVFAVFWAVWWLVTLFEKEWRYTAAWMIIIGSLALVFAIPYLKDLLHTHSGEASGGLIAFHVRPFGLTYLNFDEHTAPLKYNLVMLALLPINYLFELGFFLIAGLLYFKATWPDSDRQAYKYLMPDLALLLTSLFICTFVKSTIINNNDLGWRGFMQAQFILLIWSANILSGLFNHQFGRPKAVHHRGIRPGHWKRTTLVALLILGLGSTAYNLFYLRFFYPINDYTTFFPLPDEGRPDRQVGERNLALRNTYRYIRAHTPSSAIVQQNPDVFMDRAQGLYGLRQTVIADPNHPIIYGVSVPDIQRLFQRVVPIFEDPSLTSHQIIDLCNILNIDALVVKDTDLIWQDSNNWLWNIQPDYATSFSRVFDCKSSQ